MGNDEMKEVFRDFDALAIKEKIDAAISLAEQYNANASSGTVRLVPVDRIRLADQTDVVAEALGVELQEVKCTSGNTLYYFNYKGWEITQIALAQEGG